MSATKDGTLSFGTAIDTSNFDAGIAHIEDSVSQVGTKAEAESQRISSLLTNVPTVNINVVTNAAQSLSTIDAAYTEIDRVVDMNQAAIRELEAEYKRLGVEANTAYKKGGTAADKELAALNQQRAAINKVINERKRVVAAASQQADELFKVEQNLKKEAAAAQKASVSHSSFRSQLMNARNEMRQMVAAGQQNTQAYEEVRQKVVELTRAQNAANKQTKALASPTAQFQGIISGLSGITGAYSVATGAMGLFAAENEDLQKIMTKVQSLMTITMGLQQVQTVLNKNSAFSMITLNGLKEWWNKLLAVGTGEAVAETAATVANTTAKATNAAATTADTAAKTANNAATAAGTVAVGANTAGQIVNTGAATAGTVANIGLAGAFRMVGAAIKSIPVFGWIAAAIGVLIGVISHFIDKANEQSKALEENEKRLEEGRKKYAEASMEISNYTSRIEAFNGTKEQEKKLVEELNSKYGDALGYYDSLSKWKEVLKKKGEAYCQMLLMEAQAQAILNEYTKAFINLQEVKDKAAAGEYDHWYNTKAGDEQSRKNAIKEAQDGVAKWEKQYKELQSKIQKFKEDNDLGMHIDPNSGNKTRTRKEKEFDYEKAALEQKQAIAEWREAVKKYIKEAHDAITEATIDAMEEGQAKEINEISQSTYKKKEAWREQLMQLAEAQKNAYKEYYMAQKGATEVGWANSVQGKKSIQEYADELLQDEKIKKLYNDRMVQMEEDGQKQMAAVREKYHDALVEEFGTIEQKQELLTKQWMTKLKFIPNEFREQAFNQMEEAFSKLSTENFKKSIDWDAVFGDLGKQSLSTIQTNLEKVQKYFQMNKGQMGVQEIKDFQEAITSMENEIASRNPFTALAKSFQDISKYKSELVNALNEYANAQKEITAAQLAYNNALTYQQLLEGEINDGKLSKDSEEYKNAIDATAEAKIKLNQATEKSNRAESNALSARNNITVSYKNFSSQLRNVGGVIKDIGGKAKNLASIFSDNVADSIEKSIDFISDMLDAATTVIDAIGDTGKSVAIAMQQTAQTTGTAVQSTATATAAAISTVEKASVILAVISAALQVATAIANLFNNDDKKQKEIERLQERIDQLQWELDNADAIRLQKNTGNAIEKIKNILSETREEVLKLHLTTEQYNRSWTRAIAGHIYQNEIYQKSIKKIADAYTKVSYTADKALGDDKYKEGRKQLENLAEQQILLQRQINEENSKKKTDSGQVQEWQRQIQENAEKMATILNEMLEDIIGYTATDLATTLGDAFIEAAKQGEDAMEAWGSKVKEIVGDVMKKMLIQKYLEEPIGKIFDKYKTKWFGSDGSFKGGIQSVINSMGEFANDLNNVGEGFAKIWEQLPDTVTKWFTGDEERSGTEKGIATASQDSVDENNARLTTIQGHTYSINQGVIELNRTGNAMLVKLTAIENNTAKTNDKLDTMNTHIRNIKSNVDDIQTKGLRLRS